MHYRNIKVGPLGWALWAAALLAGGCEVHPVGRPPVTIQEYERSRSDPVRAYPPQTVVLNNLKRVLDPQLPEPQRMDSLKLVSQLGEGDESVRAQLATLLTDTSASDELGQAVLTILLRKGDPKLAVHVARVLPRLDPNSPMKASVLDWLGGHPVPQVLAEVIKLWAQEPSISGRDEPRYRLVVESLSRQKWDQALVSGINSEGFRARGSAMEVLAARLPKADLRERVAAVQAQSDCVTVMQFFLTYFGYLPTTGETMLDCVWVYHKHAELFDGAVRLCSAWRESFGYQFDIRDFHLLSRLAADPVRRSYRRTQLVMDLARDLIKRRYVPSKATGSDISRRGADRFSRHVESLSMADLWNLKLLDEMLTRPLVQRKVRAMAYYDRSDTRSAWGGLVFFENGQAEARLYPPDYGAGSSDLGYRSTRDTQRDARYSLCRFHGHFENVANAGRAGPTPEELRAAKAGDYYGLILTSLDATSFAAHYYTPAGLVISLGTFPLRE